MGIQTRFDQLCASIEEYAKIEEMNASAIAERVAIENGESLRSLSESFRYMTGNTLNAYIVSRKLTAALFYLIASEKNSISQAVGIAGYSDQPSFTKAFRRLFGITPGDAFKSKDSLKIDPPLTWNMLSETPNVQNPESLEGKNMADNESTVFGVSESRLKLVEEALGLEALYGLSRVYSDFAFKLFESRDNNYSLNDCFGFADSLRDFIGDFGEEWKEEKRELYREGYQKELTEEELELLFEKELHEKGDNQTFQRVFIECGISVSTADELMFIGNATEEMLLKCNPVMLRMYPDDWELEFEYYVRAFEYYSSRLDCEEAAEYFFEYIDLIMNNVPIEVAFDEVAPFKEAGDGIKDDWLASNDHDIEDILVPTTSQRQEDEDALWYGVRIEDDLFCDPEDDPEDDSEEDFLFGEKSHYDDVDSDTTDEEDDDDAWWREDSEDAYDDL